MNEETLNDLVEIFVEGPPLSSYSADRAVELWWSDCNTTKRVNQTLQKRILPSSKFIDITRGTSEEQPEPHATLQDWDECRNKKILLKLSVWASFFQKFLGGGMPPDPLEGSSFAHLLLKFLSHISNVSEHALSRAVMIGHIGRAA